MSWKVHRNKKRPIRKGASPVERPTEWTTAVVMLITAFVTWQANRDTAALISVGAACLPVIVTAVVAWYEERHADTVDITPAVNE